MSRFRRMLSLPMTTTGVEVYKVSFDAVVNSHSKVYYNNSTKATEIGIGYILNIGGWTASLTTGYSATAKYPINIFTTIKDTNGNIIKEQKQTTSRFSSNSNAELPIYIVVPEGKYTVEVVLKTKEFFFTRSVTFGETEIYTSKQVNFETYSEDWSTSSDSKSANGVNTTCYCFKKLISMSPSTNRGRLTFNLSKFIEETEV